MRPTTLRGAVAASMLFLASACTHETAPPLPAPIVGSLPVVVSERPDPGTVQRPPAPAVVSTSADSLAGDGQPVSGAVAVQTARTDLTAMLYFGFDEADPGDAFLQSVKRKAQILKANPSLRIRIEGHTDDRGDDEYNLSLSQRRAASIRDLLVALGVDRARLKTSAWGEERLLVRPRSVKDEDSHAQNRRAEFVVLAGSVEVAP